MPVGCALLGACVFSCADAASPRAPAPTGFPSGSAGSSEAGAGSPEAGAVVDPGPRLGANVGPNGVTFRVWAPTARGVRVVGDFPEHDVPLAAEANRELSATVKGAHAGSTYKLVFEGPNGQVERVDPYCREILSDGVTCRVVDPNAFSWKSGAFARPSRASSIVYEMHVGSFAVEQGQAAGTFTAARARLAQLAELGVDVVELMPVHYGAGRANSWGYGPQHFFALRNAYGSPDDLRAFVDEAHRLGIAVWIDTVFNHTNGSKQGPLMCFDLGCNDGSNGAYYFPPGQYASTPWGPRPNFPDPHVAEMIRDSHRQWLTEFRGDGFRIDSVSNVRAIDGAGTTPGGKELIVSINDLVHKAGALSVAEDLKGYDAITIRSADGGFGFDAQWDGFGWDVTGVLSGASDDARDLGVVERVLRGGYAGDPFARLVFTETHDTVGNGGARLPAKIDPANPTSYAARKRSILGATLMLTAPAMPMLFMGQEQLATAPFTDSPGPLPDATPQGLKVRAFYKDMIALRRNLGGGAGGLLDPNVEVLHRNDANKVIAYRRFGPSGQEVVVVLNLRNKAYTRYDVGVPSGGAWRIRLDTDWVAYGDDFGGGQSGAVNAIAQARDGQPFTLPVQLGAYGAVVLSR
jgi:1,4-alpha-glucan branching enzyme